jgi:hypothetical protein
MREDFAAYKQEEADRKARGAVVKPPVGKSVWRILPKIKGKKLTKRTWTHNVNNKVLAEAMTLLAGLPDEPRLRAAAALGVADIPVPSFGDGFAATICSSKESDKACFYCTLNSILRGIGNAAPALAATTKYLSGEISSSQEYFVGAVRMDDKAEMERGPRILKLTKGQYEDLDRIYFDKEAGGDFSDPDKGFNLIIDRIEDPTTMMEINGKSMPKTTYKMSASRTSTKIPNLDWLKHMHDLDTAREALDVGEVRRMIGPVPVAPSAPPAHQLASVPKAAAKAAVPPGREPGSDDGDDDGDPDEILANPKDANDFDTRANFAKKGIRGIPL